MSAKRTELKWESNYRCVKAMMNTMDKMLPEDIVTYATMMRNPLVFDNNVSDVKNHIPYHIPNLVGKKTSDHLIGTGNMVLYIYSKGLHRKWKNVDDFRHTLKALNVLVVVTKFMNDSGTFKKGWQFKMDDVGECLKWGNKLKSVGVSTLTHTISGEVKSVDDVWSEWYEEYKDYLS